MIEEYTLRLLHAISPAIARVPPPLYLGTLLGIIGTCLFYIPLGRGLRLFPLYLVLGVTAALVGSTVARQLPDDMGPMLGEVSVVATVLFAWVILLVARSLRL